MKRRSPKPQAHAELKHFNFGPCFCIGPQNGQPVCPCKMRNLKVVDGRYVEVIDYGPAPASPVYEYPCLNAWVKDGGVSHLSCPCSKCSVTC